MNDFERDVHAVLARHVSSLNARVLLDRARRSVGASGRLGAAELSRVVPAVCASARLFAKPEALATIERELRALSKAPDVSDVSFEVSVEDDIRACRAAARDLAAKVGARPMVQQKIATVVSELARNIVAYTPGGRIELVPVRAEPPRLTVIATDRGRGIPNLAEILAGNYRSKTGLGRGLLAAKQLMDRFEIKTGPEGTRIEVEATL